MPLRSVDPARLDGDALTNWYRRSPADIERERRAAEAERYRTYFSNSNEDGTPLDVQNRPVQSINDDPDLLLHSIYTPGDEGHFTNVEDRKRSKFRRDFIKENGPAPKTIDTRQSYHLHHDIPVGDGGTHELSNGRWMHPTDHMEHHRNNGDSARWAERARRGTGKGGPKGGGGGMARGLGVLSMVPWITGIISGRIRTDSFDNYVSDLMGFPSQEDWENYKREHQREWNPGWKPGEPLIDPRSIA